MAAQPPGGRVRRLAAAELTLRSAEPRRTRGRARALAGPSCPRGWAVLARWSDKCNDLTMFDYETVLLEVKDNVASVTLNRPEAMNAFNRTMMNEFRQIWSQVRVDDDIHVVVLRAAGDRAFSTGLDVKEGLDVPDNPWSAQDPGEDLSPTQN